MCVLNIFMLIVIVDIATQLDAQIIPRLSHYNQENIVHIFHLGAIHNCQHLNECTKHTLSQTPLPSKNVHSTFFKWIIFYEND